MRRPAQRPGSGYRTHQQLVQQKARQLHLRRPAVEPDAPARVGAGRDDQRRGEADEGHLLGVHHLRIGSGAAYQPVHGAASTARSSAVASQHSTAALWIVSLV